ncbi:hypothetical protein FZEAL_1214 [Fusarium zealandicum]|uniref:Uncharacterized protein n=1 Tax=Fusarium zealandicum TaxID=1053134 RepID=A0A8H4UT76_9HYPO|nr:hypothetical protein FZEAL_1214 [Fusarium zealandicum]
MSAVTLPRRFYSLLWLALLLVVAIFFLSLREDAWSSIPRPPKSWRIPFTTDDGVISSWTGSNNGSDSSSSSGNENAASGSTGATWKGGEPLRITLVESTGTHDEVAAALLHSFGGQENTQLDAYFANQRFQMPAIMGNFSLKANLTVHKYDAFAPAMLKGPRPHVIVSTTCEFDLDRATTPFVELLKAGTTYLFCTIHHADRWHQGKYVQVVRGWAEHDMVDFVGLSQHTVDFLLKESIPKWHSIANITTRVIPPVFPVNVPDDVDDGISLAMQGDYSSGRRDYTGIFNHLGSVIRKAGESGKDRDAEKVALHVIGHGKTPEVPDHVKSNIIFDQGLSYPDFYALLSKSFSIIPGFASDTYFDRKASSTIPASLIAGAPIVASEELLKAYSYLPREATWVARPGEGEMDVIERVIHDRKGFLERRKIVRETAKKLLESNRQNIAGWISQALEKVEQKNKN